MAKEPSNYGIRLEAYKSLALEIGHQTELPEHVCPKYILGLCYSEKPGKFSTLEFYFSLPFTVGRNAGTVCSCEFGSNRCFSVSGFGHDNGYFRASVD